MLISAMIVPKLLYSCYSEILFFDSLFKITSSQKKKKNNQQSNMVLRSENQTVLALPGGTAVKLHACASGLAPALQRI